MNDFWRGFILGIGAIALIMFFICYIKTIEQAISDYKNNSDKNDK
jgi:hypothetical protein